MSRRNLAFVAGTVALALALASYTSRRASGVAAATSAASPAFSNSHAAARSADESPRAARSVERTFANIAAPAEAYLDGGDRLGRDAAPPTGPLVPPVFDIGTIELGRGARASTEPLIPPEAFVDAGDLAGPTRRR